MNTNRKSSAVWDYFTDIGGSLVKCNLCKTQIKCFSGSTSSMTRHVGIRLTERRGQSSANLNIDDPAPVSNVAPAVNGPTQAQASSSRQSETTQYAPKRTPRMEQGISQHITKPIVTSDCKRISSM
ncbi:hypothetical protein M8J77_022544 [Diaphorina citri]|nr:hypothetical protein M8J77_022544 [Diaphorina citri]